MATVCGKLYKGQDLSCGIKLKGYVQELVLINKDDVGTSTVTVDCGDSTDSYNVEFELKEGKKGVLFQGPKAGNVIRALVNKTRDDNGLPEYEHGVNMLVGGVNQEQKCILTGLDKGLVFAAVKLKYYESNEEAIEIIGFNNGLSSSDYEYDITENGGIVPIELRSLENSLEADLPYMYKAGSGGDAIADFEALFESEPA